MEPDVNLKTVLNRTDASNMKLNHKCVFAVNEVHFLGHNISAQGLSPLELKVHAIRNTTPPTDSKTLQSFLGLAGYYATFLPHYADVVEPLRCMFRQGHTFEWSDKADASFNKIKELLSNNPVK